MTQSLEDLGFCCEMGALRWFERGDIIQIPLENNL